jgi:ketosteroid isomerase-like protein
VRGIIGIAREFDQTTIAEGVEDQATLVRLRELGVDFGQGYLFGRPEPLADAALPTPSAGSKTRADVPGPDPVQLVRTAFAAFAERDIDTMLNMCAPAIVLRPHGTSERAGRDAPYRGHEGLHAYVKDIAAVWTSLVLTPTAFRLSNQAVIVFGHVDTDTGTQAETIDVLWIWQLRDGQIVSHRGLPDPSPKPDAGIARRPVDVPAGD